MKKRSTAKGFTAIVLLWLAGIVFNLALIVAAIWVAWHFISKWW